MTKKEYTGILCQRRIEANVIRAFHDELTREFGLERSRALVASVIHQLAHQKGRELRVAHPSGDLAAIINLWESLSSGGALDIDFFEKSAECLHFRVTRCGYADAYREMGISPELGTLLSCDRDEPLLQGYSDKITIERSRTIMDGEKYCEFIYKMKK
jgi:hypothetical protein